MSIWRNARTILMWGKMARAVITSFRVVGVSESSQGQ